MTTAPETRSRTADKAAVLGLVAVLLVPVFGMLALIGAIWLSDHTHRFGPYDPRYLLLIHRTTVDRLGLVSPVAGSIEYAARGRDGNSPAFAAVTFRTSAPPALVIATYRERCLALALTPAQDADPLRLGCTGPDGDDIGIGAAVSGGATVVTVGGWVF